MADTRDVLEFLAKWAVRDPRAHVVHDGKIDILDLIAFPALWNRPCL